MHRNEWDATPLTGSSARIMRGFSRIGVGAAAITAVLGLTATANLAINDYWPGNRVQTDPVAWGAFPEVNPSKSNIPPFDPSKPYEIATKNSPNPLISSTPNPASKPFDPDEYLAFKRIEALKSAALTILIGLGITGAACLAVFGFFSGLGWVIAGFARD
jgi:hypothetical protein